MSKTDETPTLQMWPWATISPLLKAGGVPPSPQSRPRAAISSRSRAALSCGVSFAIAAAFAAAATADAAAASASAASAALKHSLRPLPSLSADTMALKAASCRLMSVHAMSAAYRVVSCCFAAGIGGLHRSRIELSNLRSSAAPSALPYASASAMSPDMATTASFSTCSAPTSCPGCCTSSSSYTTTRGAPLASTTTSCTGRPSTYAHSRCDASCVHTRSARVRRCSSSAAAALSASTGTNRSPGAVEPIARMAIGMPAKR
mmetsp:Transcript_39021/g.91272  ORF Transcript_39021/g.91272 Transcript_39021/m.91272 type:complete len:261 (-) Transcript_39021:152-934(-)